MVSVRNFVSNKRGEMKNHHMQEVQIRNTMAVIEVFILLSKQLSEDDAYWDSITGELERLGAEVAVGDAIDLCGIRWGFETIEK